MRSGDGVGTRKGGDVMGGRTEKTRGKNDPDSSFMWANVQRAVLGSQ